MALEERVYITGHQHPDTDATAAAIAYSFFKRTQGVPAVACRLGELNSETKYLLERFHFDEPLLLEDARKKLNEIKIDGPLSTRPDTSVFDTLKLMQDTDQPYIGIVDENNLLLGMVSKSDLVNVGLGDTALGIDLLRQTSVKGIAHTISGKVVYDDKKVHINGKVSIIAITQSRLANYDITDRIVICGDDADAHGLVSLDVGFHGDADHGNGLGSVELGRLRDLGTLGLACGIRVVDGALGLLKAFQLRLERV